MIRAWAIGVGAAVVAVLAAGSAFFDPAPVGAWMTGPLLTPGLGLGVAALTFAVAAVLDHDT